MLKIKLKGENGEMIIDEYNVSFPYSIYTENHDGSDIYWNLNSIECRNTQGSFRLSYCYKIDISNQSVGLTNVDSDGNDIKRVNTLVDDDHLCKQHLLFTKHTLIYIDERNTAPSLHLPREKITRFLIKKETNAKETIQFFLQYDERRHQTLYNEEITLFLNLYLEK